MSEAYMNGGKSIENATAAFYEVRGNTNITIDTKGFYIFSAFNAVMQANFNSNYNLAGYIKNGAVTQLASDGGRYTVTCTAGTLNFNCSNGDVLYLTLSKVN